VKHIVIIGASVAGLAAARTIQALSGIRLTIVESTSDFPPYDPPRLSKEGLFDGSSLLPDTARLQFSPGSNTVVLSGVAATGLDPDIKIIHLSDGRSIHYDKLVIATGGRARQWPGANPKKG
jgi:NADPH-dependent 2,4-dienoyl-CoA reductase/sulfur reductase-like enzyme